MASTRALKTIAVLISLALWAGAGADTYTLKWGDTLGKVAKRFGVTIESLAEANGIKNPGRVREGQVLSVPKNLSGAKAVAVVTPGPAGAGASSGTGRVHKVRPGETLGRIAATYKVTVDDLMKLNGIKDARKVRDGKELVLPEGAKAAVEKLPCPVKGAHKQDISNSYGTPRPGYRRHMGNDIFAKRGTPVIAPIGGKLTFANGKVAGNAFYIAGDDGRTYYGAHLHAFAVEGEGRVEQGQVIGTVGRTGNAEGTPAHLHFEIKPDGSKSIDPHALLISWCR